MRHPQQCIRTTVADSAMLWDLALMRLQHLGQILTLLAHDIEDFKEGQADFLLTMRQRLRDFGDWKSLSYMGGLPAVYDFHPKHWEDYRTGVWYFDPSNYVYAKAIRVACPSFIADSGISDEETLGDCIEAVLGLERALTSQSQTGESYELLRTRWPGSGISVARAARFWRIISTHLFYIEWVEGLLSEARSA